MAQLAFLMGGSSISLSLASPSAVGMNGKHESALTEYNMSIGSLVLGDCKQKAESKCGASLGTPLCCAIDIFAFWTATL